MKHSEVIATSARNTSLARGDCTVLAALCWNYSGNTFAWSASYLLQKLSFKFHLISPRPKHGSYSDLTALAHVYTGQLPKGPGLKTLLV